MTSMLFYIHKKINSLSESEKEKINIELVITK